MTEHVKADWGFSNQVVCWLARRKSQVHTVIMEQRQRPWVKPMGLVLAPPRKGKHHHFQLLQFSFLSHGTEWHAMGRMELSIRIDTYSRQGYSFTSGSPSWMSLSVDGGVAPRRFWAASLSCLVPTALQVGCESGIRDVYGLCLQIHCVGKREVYCETSTRRHLWPATTCRCTQMHMHKAKLSYCWKEHFDFHCIGKYSV